MIAKFILSLIIIVIGIFYVVFTVLIDSILELEYGTLLVFLIAGILILILTTLQNLFSRYVFKEIGFLYTDSNKMIFEFQEGNNNQFFNHNISNICFIYQGDYLWKAKNRIFQKSKSRRRYSQYIGRFEKIKTLDKITIDSKEYLVKIQNTLDKENFFKLVNWAEENSIDFELIEE